MNRLSTSSSPYLLQHADNPVHWFPWGPEAFEKAEQEGKPIFLSIGYSTCHWCHVMAHESFENAEIAAYLNEHYVSIKVDREERPDVDRIYMSYVQAVTGHGGWPLNVWLTPDRKPFFGGTYFPPVDRPNMRGFRSLLEAIARGWHDDRNTLVMEANRVIATLANHTRNAAAPSEATEGAVDLVDAGGVAFEKCFQHLYEAFDAENGGFGESPKFPRASNLHFLFRAAAIQGPSTEAGKEAIMMATTTLRQMARGGIHDSVGGGFHRYAVDAAWFVPHFEKMLYDQAQIALNYLEAEQATGEPVYGQVARGIFDYVARDLTHPDGGFYSAEDADSLSPDGRGHAGKAEGAFYLWTKREIDEVLGGVSALICAHFGVLEEGNVPAELDPSGEFKGLNILHQVRPLSETATMFKLEPATASDRLHEALRQLRERRARRPRPACDDKIVAGWNGLMISALARGGRILADTTLVDRARRAAQFLYSEMHDEGTGLLYRSFRGRRGETEAFAEDYAFVIQGLLDLYESCFETRWLLWAERLQRSMDELFWDKATGGYFASSARDASLVLRLKEDYDGAEPAANSVAAMNLFRFRAFFPTETIWEERGRATLEGLRSQWEKWPQAVPQLLCAIEWALETPRQALLVGSPERADFQGMVRELSLGLEPRRVLLAVTGRPDDAGLLERLPVLRDYAHGETTTAYLCEKHVCLAPAKSPAELAHILRP